MSINFGVENPKFEKNKEDNICKNEEDFFNYINQKLFFLRYDGSQFWQGQLFINFGDDSEYKDVYAEFIDLNSSWIISIKVGNQNYFFEKTVMRNKGFLQFFGRNKPQNDERLNNDEPIYCLLYQDPGMSQMMGARNESNVAQDANDNISLTFGHEGFHRIITNQIIGNEKLEKYIIRFYSDLVSHQSKVDGQQNQNNVKMQDKVAIVLQKYRISEEQKKEIEDLNKSQNKKESSESEKVMESLSTHNNSNTSNLLQRI